MLAGALARVAPWSIERLTGSVVSVTGRRAPRRLLRLQHETVSYDSSRANGPDLPGEQRALGHRPLVQIQRDVSGRLESL